MNLKQKNILNYLRGQRASVFNIILQAIFIKFQLGKILQYKVALISQYSLMQIIFLSFSSAYASSQVDSKAVNQFKLYLREIRSIAVDFHQSDLQGSKASGQLLIDKPYKFRCNYNQPFPLVILGNKNYVVVYDYDMEQASRIKSNENIFNFLLVDEIDFEKYFNFESAVDQGGVLEVTLYHPLTERRCQINFDKNSKQIKILKIFENNNEITLEFGLINKVANFDDNLFIFKDPDIFGHPARLTKDEIEKKYTLAQKN